MHTLHCKGQIPREKGFLDQVKNMLLSESDPNNRSIKATN